MDLGNSPGLLTVTEMRLKYIYQNVLYWLERSSTHGLAAAAAPYGYCLVKRTMLQSPTFMRMHSLYLCV